MWVVEPPDSGPFVIRGGLFPTADNVLTAVSDSYEDGDGAVASVFVGAREEGESRDQALRRLSIEANLPHSKIRVASLSALEAAGFELTQDTSDGQPPCHYNVVFTEPPHIDQAKLFEGCFGAPIANPAKD